MSLHSMHCAVIARKRAAVGAPTLTAASVDSNGLTLRLTFSRNIVIGAGGNGGISTSFTTAGSRTATYSSTSANVLLYTLDKTINSGDTGTVSYTQPGNGIEASNNAVDVASFSTISATNNSTVSVHLSSATIANAAQPHTVTLNWAENKTKGAGWSGSDITLTINGSEGFSTTYISGDGTAIWILNYLSTQLSTDIIKVSFTGAANAIENGGVDTPAFTNRAVTNNIP